MCKISVKIRFRKEKNMSIGDNIRKARLNLGMNQHELSNKLVKQGINVGNTTISNWENNISKPDPDTISALCEILNVDGNYILGFESNYGKETELIKLINECKNILTTEDEKYIKMIIEQRKIEEKKKDEAKDE
jgi:repressor LexA